jgi:small subunit ribosomal protein S21
MLIIEIGRNENIDRALKRLKKKFDNTGVVRELRKRKEFKKKSEERREEIKKAKFISKKFKDD